MMKVEEFLTKFRMPLPDEPTLHDFALAFHRLGLIAEELIEYEEALVLAFQATTEEERTHYLEQMVDALGDIIYSTVGTALIHGFDIVSAMMEIHRANMAKERGVGKRGHECDVIKPEGWQGPKHNVKRKRCSTTYDLFRVDNPSLPQSSSYSEQLSLPLLEFACGLSTKPIV